MNSDDTFRVVLQSEFYPPLLIRQALEAYTDHLSATCFFGEQETTLDIAVVAPSADSQTVVGEFLNYVLDLSLKTLLKRTLSAS